MLWFVEWFSSHEDTKNRSFTYELIESLDLTSRNPNIEAQMLGYAIANPIYALTVFTLLNSRYRISNYLIIVTIFKSTLLIRVYFMEPVKNQFTTCQRFIDFHIVQRTFRQQNRSVFASASNYLKGSCSHPKKHGTHGRTCLRRG